MAAIEAGSVRITASGVVGISGKPVTIYGYSFLSGGTAGVVILTLGTDGTGVEKHRQSGTINVGTTVQLGAKGKYFPTGAYVTVDANTTYVDFDFVNIG